METPSVRVLVVGDSGVGKTALLRSICRLYSPDAFETDKQPPLWTTGCDVHVLLKRLEPEGQEVFVEFLDVGGHCKYELSRRAFYHNVHGIMFVHDLSNPKSGEHLWNWSSELQDMQQRKGCVVPLTGNLHNAPTLADVPKLVVGNKQDLLPQTYQVDPTRLLGSVGFQAVACLASSIEPRLLRPRGVLETFLHQTVAFANRDGRSNSNSFSGKIRSTHRARDVITGSAKSGLSPLPPGSGSVRSRWW